ncbi:MAG: hypothetical protein M3277_12535 [Actinomycetota bacterium]|nr:hypothetical protein [Actinomycetota bacterium]
MTNTAKLPEHEKRRAPLFRSRLLYACIVVGVASFAVATAISGNDTTRAVAFAAPQPPGDMAATSDEATVASGRHGNQAWTLRAYRAAGRPETPAEGERALCLRWRLGERQPLSNGCTIGRESLSAGDYFAASSHVAESATAFFGTVDSSASSLELESDSGTQPVEVYPSPRGLRLSFDFFVAFAPAGEDVTIRAIAEDGSTLRQQTWTALPRVTTSVEGSGDGIVVGSHDCETAACSPLAERERIIDCGSDCWADVLKGQVVELRAEPALGSRFTGWSGACEGLGDCTVAVDSNAHATAHFEQVP